MIFVKKIEHDCIFFFFYNTMIEKIYTTTKKGVR